MVQQRLKIVEICYKNSNSVLTCFCALHELFDPQNWPFERTIRRILKKFEETGSVYDINRIRYQRTARSMENIAAVSW